MYALIEVSSPWVSIYFIFIVLVRSMPFGRADIMLEWYTEGWVGGEWQNLL